MTNKKQKLILFLVFIVAFFLRVLFLESVPVGLTDDEAAISYNAYLISQTGKDEWGSFLPIQFRSFGDWKLPVYIYLLSIVFKFFPLSIFWTKIISVLLGSLTVVLLYYFVLLFLDKEKQKHSVALLSSLILVFNPWHIGLSRTASEVNIGLFFFIGALYFFKLFLENKLKKAYLFFGLIIALICFFSYHSYRILLPLTFIYLYFINRERKQRKKLAVKIFLASIISAIFLFIFTQGKFLVRFYQLSLFSNTGIVDELNEFRGACLTKFPFSFCRLFFNKPVFWTKHLLFNYTSHLSPQFLFFPAFEKAYSILPHYPYFYSFSILFFIIGIIASARNEKKRILYFLLLISPFGSALTGRGNFTRAFPLVLPIVIFIALGMVYFFNFLKKIKLSFLILLPILVYCFFGFEFLISYFTYFPLRQARYSHYEYKPLFQYLKEVESNYNHIYISRANHDARQYIFYLFYFKIKPAEYFALEKDVEVEDGGWAWVRKLGKFEFIDNVESLKNYPEKSLLVVDPQTVKGFPKPMDKITYPNNEGAFNIYDIDQVRLMLKPENEKD
ncbi:hypothetical protein COT75_01775 [Candidatus Beckwithbacteria bacterium CG10_big_fil_rev_8_21_14_0_10_34_10]|uniref:Glycosyltransferase RgtA/B/C/D-like domain-containing protein n=1 Tax=Candidatus Beckwithbacteria bacterium CG10_big_fil_rev_8_21_14_0_10_34_10 TaxID=1974495 RepID=A0A2H0W9S6_9BACT|nr:MAG: hypothetical protein COT75_01775 [Candidatus Beckwithbacteria bacterium CG10_big_fil_rev_8_21_14_0_10_34_10]